VRRALETSVGDVDGKPDLAATNPNNGSINLFINDGAGRLAAPTTYSVGKNPDLVSIDPRRLGSWSRRSQSRRSRN
jgi:hypothetical protein